MTAAGDAPPSQPSIRGASPTRATEEKATRPFRIKVPEEALADLRRCLAAAKWTEKETVTDDSQGVALSLMRELARNWGTDYDWRKVEARLNALPAFITEIDGLDIPRAYPKLIHYNKLG
jgi:hypothetical protein